MPTNETAFLVMYIGAALMVLGLVMAIAGWASIR